jgi:hypothetical protein
MDNFQREAMKDAAFKVGKPLGFITAIPILLCWIIAMYGWLGIFGVIIGIGAFPSYFVAPFVMLAFNGFPTLTKVTLCIWAVHMVAVILWGLSGREPAAEDY